MPIPRGFGVKTLALVTYDVNTLQESGKKRRPFAGTWIETNTQRGALRRPSPRSRHA